VLGAAGSTVDLLHFLWRMDLDEEVDHLESKSSGVHHMIVLVL